MAIYYFELATPNYERVVMSPNKDELLKEWNHWKRKFKGRRNIVLSKIKTSKRSILEARTLNKSAHGIPYDKQFLFSFPRDPNWRATAKPIRKRIGRPL